MFSFFKCIPLLVAIISPGLTFVRKAFLLGLFSEELIFGGAYYWREFCVSKWVGLDNKNSLKHYENSLKQLTTASTNTPWTLTCDRAFFFFFFFFQAKGRGREREEKIRLIHLFCEPPTAPTINKLNCLSTVR